MQQLVALDLAGGRSFVVALRSVWDAGDAALVVDRRLPPPARQVLLDLARPTSVIDDTGRRATVDTGAPPVEAGDALVVASSGTTGTPRLSVHTHDGLLAHARAVHDRLEVDPASDRWLACLPLAHLGGLGVVVRSVVTGTGVDVIDGFDRDLVVEAPATLGSTLTSLVPTALDRIDPTGFRWIVLGGSADPAERPANVVRTYGLTESGGGVVYDGRPLAGVEVRVDERGRIALRGATLARGHRQADGRVVDLTDAEGWLHTGDLGRWEHGALIVDGRADDLIVTGGENVWPDEVEAVLATHAGVAEVAVVGRPDDTWGQVVAAVVVPAPGAPAPTLDELRGHVRTHLASHAAPRTLDLVASLPRTALGKVRRAALAAVPDGSPDQ